MEQTLEDFVRAELPGLTRYATALCGDPDQAADLVQDVLARAFLKWDRIRRTDRPAAYLTRMLTNEFVSWRRRRSTRLVVLTDDATLERVGEAGRDHADLVADRDDLDRRLARLPRKQLATLVLRYYVGLDNAEAAVVLGCTESTVRATCSRALAALRAEPVELATALTGRRTS